MHVITYIFYYQAFYSNNSRCGYDISQTYCSHYELNVATSPTEMIIKCLLLLALINTYIASQQKHIFIKLFKPENEQTHTSKSDNQWYIYVLKRISEVIQYNYEMQDKQKGGTSLVNMIDILTFQLSRDQPCRESTFHYQTDVTMTAPCGIMNFMSLALSSMTWTSMTWTISVHQTFMINITIYKAYIPFTDMCSPHYIQIHEGHNMSKESLIELFCGHTYTENIYTKDKTGMII